MTHVVPKAGNIKFALSGHEAYVDKIATGETFKVECAINIGDGILTHAGQSIDPAKIVIPFVNGATGPMEIEGARPGDMLVVEIIDMELDHLGFTALWPGIGMFPDWVRQKEFGFQPTFNLPSGPTLARRMFRKLGHDVNEDSMWEDLIEASTQFYYGQDEGLGEEGLIEFLRAELAPPGSEPNENHCALVELGPKVVYTTNPDKLLERALELAGISFTVILRSPDFDRLSRSDDVQVIKLHGDLDEPDTLVFTRPQYDEYPKDELVSVTLKSDIARSSLVFIGYSASDSNLTREWKWVRSHGVLRDHFIVSDTFTEARRRELEDSRLRCIAIGDFVNYPQFLSELKALVEAQKGRGAPAGSVSPTDSEPVDPSVQEALADLFEEARSALDKGQIHTAVRRLETLLPLARSAAEGGGPAELEFAQRTTLALANAYQWQGERTRAVELYRAVRESGFASTSRAAQACFLLINLGMIDELADVVDEVPRESEHGAKVRAYLAHSRRDYSTVLSLIPEDTNDTDLRILRLRARLWTVTEADVDNLRSALDEAWDSTDGLARLALIEVCEHLLRHVLARSLSAPGFDREDWLNKLRLRYAETIEHMEALAAEFPGGLSDALIAAAEFHRFIDDEAEASRLEARLGEEPANAFLAQSVGALDDKQIDSLYEQGFLSRVQQVNTKARRLQREGDLDRALAVHLELDLLTVREEALPETLELRLLLLMSTGRQSDAIREVDRVVAHLDRLPAGIAFLNAVAASFDRDEAVSLQAFEALHEDYPASYPIVNHLVRLYTQKFEESAKAPLAGTRQISPETPGYDPYQKAVKYGQEMVALLPSPENKIRYAALVAYDNPEAAREALASVRSGGYRSRSLFQALSNVHERLGQDEAATKAAEEALREFPEDEHLAIRVAHNYLVIDAPEEAVRVLEPRREGAGAELLFILAEAKLRLAATLGGEEFLPLARDAFSILREVHAINPKRPGLDAALLEAGRASGHEAEAFSLIHASDVDEGSGLTRIGFEEGVEMLRAEQKLLDAVQGMGEEGLISHVDRLKYSGGAWLNWTRATRRFLSAWQRADVVSEGLVAIRTSLPSGLTATLQLPGSLVVDRSALLTLGTLEATGEIFRALRKARCSVYLTPGTTQWLRDETANLSHSVVFLSETPSRLVEAVRAGDVSVRVRTQEGPSELPDELTETGPQGFDLLEAKMMGAAYVSDLNDNTLADRYLAGNVLTSSQALTALVASEAVSEELAATLRTKHPSRFGGADASPPATAEAFVLDRFALQSWFDSGLLAELSKVTATKIAVGPWAWHDLSEEAERYEITKVALGRARGTLKAVQRSIEEGSVTEAPSPAPLLLPDPLDDIWRSASELGASAFTLGATVWADDYFFSSIALKGTRPVSNADLSEAISRLHKAISDTQVLGTDLLLLMLNKERAVSTKRASDLTRTLWEQGYRPIDLRAVLRESLLGAPPSPPFALNYRRILHELLTLRSRLPPDSTPMERDFHSSLALSHFAPSLITETWRSSSPSLSTEQRKAFADAVLEASESAFGELGIGSGRTDSTSHDNSTGEDEHAT